MPNRLDVLVLKVLADAPSEGTMRVTHLRDVGIDMRQIQRLAAAGLVSFTGPHGDRVVAVTPEGHQRLSPAAGDRGDLRVVSRNLRLSAAERPAGADSRHGDPAP